MKKKQQKQKRNCYYKKELQLYEWKDFFCQLLLYMPLTAELKFPKRGENSGCRANFSFFLFDFHSLKL